MPSNIGIDHKTLFYLLIVVVCSSICYVMMTSPTSPLLQRARERHAGDKRCDNNDGASAKQRNGITNGTHGNTTLHNHTATANESRSASQHFVPKNGKIVMNDSLTSHLWHFKDLGDQQLYLYENLLKREWTPNRTRTEMLRQELARYRSELKENSDIIMHQKNSKTNERLKFVYNKAKNKKLTRSMYKNLVKTSPFSKDTRYNSCAIIGNSGVMLDSGCGKEVDKHDFVFRCNLAPLAPFKEDAGMKSNFTTMNPSILGRYYGSLKKTANVNKYNTDLSQYNGLIWIQCFGFEHQLQLAMKAISLFRGARAKMICGNPKYSKAVIGFWSERGLNPRLSSGFYLVTTALQLCDEVQLYGFWPFSARFGENRTEVPYHYFDKLTLGEANSVHEMDREFDTLVQLHTMGVLRLNVGACR